MSFSLASCIAISSQGSLNRIKKTFREQDVFVNRFWKPNLFNEKHIIQVVGDTRLRITFLSNFLSTFFYSS